MTRHSEDLNNETSEELMPGEKSEKNESTNKSQTPSIGKQLESLKAQNTLLLKLDAPEEYIKPHLCALQGLVSNGWFALCVYDLIAKPDDNGNSITTCAARSSKTAIEAYLNLLQKLYDEGISAEKIIALLEVEAVDNAITCAMITNIIAREEMANAPLTTKLFNLLASMAGVKNNDEHQRSASISTSSTMNLSNNNSNNNNNNFWISNSSDEEESELYDSYTPEEPKLTKETAQAIFRLLQISDSDNNTIGMQILRAHTKVITHCELLNIYYGLLNKLISYIDAKEIIGLLAIENSDGDNFGEINAEYVDAENYLKLLHELTSKISNAHSILGLLEHEAILKKIFKSDTELSSYFDLLEKLLERQVDADAIADYLNKKAKGSSESMKYPLISYFVAVANEDSILMGRCYVGLLEALRDHDISHKKLATLLFAQHQDGPPLSIIITAANLSDSYLIQAYLEMILSLKDSIAVKEIFEMLAIHHVAISNSELPYYAGNTLGMVIASSSKPRQKLDVDCVSYYLHMLQLLLLAKNDYSNVVALKDLLAIKNYKVSDGQVVENFTFATIVINKNDPKLTRKLLDIFMSLRARGISLTELKTLIQSEYIKSKLDKENQYFDMIFEEKIDFLETLNGIKTREDHGLGTLFFCSWEVWQPALNRLSQEDRGKLFNVFFDARVDKGFFSSGDIILTRNKKTRFFLETIKSWVVHATCFAAFHHCLENSKDDVLNDVIAFARLLDAIHNGKEVKFAKEKDRLLIAAYNKIIEAQRFTKEDPGLDFAQQFLTYMNFLGDLVVSDNNHSKPISMLILELKAIGLFKSSDAYNPHLARMIKDNLELLIDPKSSKEVIADAEEFLNQQSGLALMNACYVTEGFFFPKVTEGPELQNLMKMEKRKEALPESWRLSINITLKTLLFRAQWALYLEKDLNVIEKELRRFSIVISRSLSLHPYETGWVQAFREAYLKDDILYEFKMNYMHMATPTEKTKTIQTKLETMISKTFTSTFASPNDNDSGMTPEKFLEEIGLAVTEDNLKYARARLASDSLSELSNNLARMEQ